MNRTAYQDLLTWKQDAARKPLLIQGARQVGKTWLIRNFGEKEYKKFYYFNFEEMPKLSTAFEHDLTPEKVLESLSAVCGEFIEDSDSLIFLDEIQICPRALTSLKYFCEQAPKYHIIAAGSLLGVSVGKTSSFPVGKVNFLSLYPLSFFEFLLASGDAQLLLFLQKNTGLNAIPELLHDKLTMRLRQYFFLGGMPEAVQSFIQKKDYFAARKIQQEILKAYQRDFSKYTTPTQAVRISEIWRSIPTQLARENKKFKYSEVHKSGRATQFESAIEWLRNAGLVYTAINVTTAKLPIAGYEEPLRFKAYTLDCGLLGAMIDTPAQEMVLGDAIFSEYNGAFVENFIASELARKNEGALHYWVSDGVAEVDFLVVHNQKILPLEVKSGLNRNIKSLRIYADKFKPARIFRTSPRNFEMQEDFTNLPLYAIGLFPEMFG